MGVGGVSTFANSGDFEPFDVGVRTDLGASPPVDFFADFPAEVKAATADATSVLRLISSLADARTLRQGLFRFSRSEEVLITEDASSSSSPRKLPTDRSKKRRGTADLRGAQHPHAQ